MDKKNSLWYLHKKITSQKENKKNKDNEKDIEEMEKKIHHSTNVLSRIEVVVTVKCNLRCVDCNHLMNHYKKPYDIDPYQIIEQLEVLLDCVDICICVGITGGEPFLYKHLDMVVGYLCKHDKVYFVEINTNGTSLPSSISYLYHEKVSVYISRYSVVPKPIHLLNALEKYGVSYKYEDEMPWINYGNFNYTPYRKSQLIRNYMQCADASFCKLLLNGRLYCCPRCAFVNDLSIVQTNDYIDLMRHESKAELSVELKEFYGRRYAEICNYCHLMSAHTLNIQPGIQKK